jgi:hypothetical protein
MAIAASKAGRRLDPIAKARSKPVREANMQAARQLFEP